MQGLIQMIGCFLLSLLCLLPARAVDLNTCKEDYQKSAAEISQSSQTEFEALQQQYGKLLVALKGTFQNQGELKKTKAALAEMDRFQKEKCLPLEDSEIPEIKALQVSYVKRYSQLEQELVRRLGARTVQYEQDLAGLLKALTKAGRLEEATAVETGQAEAQREIKRFADQLAALKAGATSGTVMAKLFPTGNPGAKDGLYLVVDLSGGPTAEKYPISYLPDVPKGGWTDEYKTGKLVLRRIEPGTFTMGSPENELVYGRETQHNVMLTKGFYIGVFEVTQKQWEQVLGDWPSHFNNPKCREARPVEKVSYDDIRGASAGANWPGSERVDDTSFMGGLRKKADKAFDLPTAAQWEYACRAGTVSALNSGKNLTDTTICPNADEVGRYKANSGTGDRDGDTRVGTAKAGSYLPNNWGLYDMHGNVWEWCLDWKEGGCPVEGCDPQGPLSGSKRVARGGSWDLGAADFRSARHTCYKPDTRWKSIGFRVAVPAGPP